MSLTKIVEVFLILLFSETFTIPISWLDLRRSERQQKKIGVRTQLMLPCQVVIQGSN